MPLPPFGLADIFPDDTTPHPLPTVPANLSSSECDVLCRLMRTCRSSLQAALRRDGLAVGYTWDLSCPSLRSPAAPSRPQPSILVVLCAR